MKAKLIFIFLFIICIFSGCSKSGDGKVISNNINNNIPKYEDKNTTQNQTTEEAIEKSTEATTESSKKQTEKSYNNEKPKTNVKKESTKQDTKQISFFTTYFNTSNTPRVNNIKIAGKAINGVVIHSGEIFSYNNTIGKTTKEKGYQQAKVVSNGKEIKDYGGGVCQVSTTLFNAADKAGMEILERHSHSKAVDYVPKDRDAATSYGYLDMRFKNNKDYPVVIKCDINNGAVNISINKA